MPRITPFLWYDTQAEEAAKLYTSIFPNSKITKVTRYGEAGPSRTESVTVVEFELDGQTFQAMSAGPHFKFNEAISLVVECKSQEEVDYYWRKLTADGGAESQCGWLKDKYGLSWQITPTALMEMMNDPDKAKASRVMGAMLKMKKIDIVEIKSVAEGK